VEQEEDGVRWGQNTSVQLLKSFWIINYPTLRVWEKGHGQKLDINDLVEKTGEGKERLWIKKQQ